MLGLLARKPEARMMLVGHDATCVCVFDRRMTRSPSPTALPDLPVVCLFVGRCAVSSKSVRACVICKIASLTHQGPPSFFPDFWESRSGKHFVGGKRSPMICSFHLSVFTTMKPILFFPSLSSYSR